MSNKTICPECGKGYKQLGQHWTGSCSPSNLTNNQKDVITGLMMGDGSLDRYSKRPRLKVVMISENYLKYLDDVFGCLGTGVRLHQTAAKSAKSNRDSKFQLNAKEENYSDLYIWRTRSLSELHEFNWYKTGKKVWPENIKLTPTVLKHWYCGDGHFEDRKYQKYITITMSNEVENTDKVSNYFEEMGLPSPSNYKVYEQNGGNNKCDAQFTVSQSEILWEYMRSPLPDFEYKWPKSYR